MIFALTGDIVLREKDFVVMNVNDVSYKIFLIRRNRLSGSERITIFTHLLLKESELVLYGFLTSDDRTLFLNLISVNGIGPRIAELIMNPYDNEEIIQAIRMEHSGFFSGISGVGNAIVNQLFFSLKRVYKDQKPNDINLDLAFSALRNLGFKDIEIQNAYHNSRDDIRNENDAEGMIKVILSHIQKRKQ